MAIEIPTAVKSIFSHFPLHTYPATYSPYQAQPIRTPTLWVRPPRSAKAHNEPGSPDVLSGDVECLKWQAYLALRFSQAPQPTRVAVRWDVSVSGALDGRLPNLHVPLDTVPASLIGSSEDREKKVKDDGEGEVLPAHHIPEWVNGRLGEENGELEGYRDPDARDESRAWVALLEGNVHAALLAFSPAETSLLEKISPDPSSKSLLTGGSLSVSLIPPPAPLTGLLSLLPAYGERIDLHAIEEKYRGAIKALSDRLGEDTWILGSANPTPLDALLFAYLHALLHAKDKLLRFEVERRENLVAYEGRIRAIVTNAFVPYRK